MMGLIVILMIVTAVGISFCMKMALDDNGHIGRLTRAVAAISMGLSLSLSLFNYFIPSLSL